MLPVLLVVNVLECRANPSAKSNEAPQKSTASLLNSEEFNKRLTDAVQRNLKAQALGTPSTGFGAARLGGKAVGGAAIPPEVMTYKATISKKIKSGWVWPDPEAVYIAKVLMTINPDGQISDIQITKGSGNSAFDKSVIAAIKKANPLPPPPSKYYEEFKKVSFTFDARH